MQATKNASEQYASAQPASDAAKMTTYVGISAGSRADSTCHVVITT